VLAVGADHHGLARPGNRCEIDRLRVDVDRFRESEQPVDERLDATLASTMRVARWSPAVRGEGVVRWPDRRERIADAVREPAPAVETISRRWRSASSATAR
jgi:hypothetical protein